ncbi:MAG: uroporphyrinogen-III synthase [Gallionella sp.]
MTNLPLAGLKILVTRPRDQAVQLAKAIEQAGGIPLLFPLLDIAPVQEAHCLQQQIKQLPAAKLAIFISPNAVKYAIDALYAVGLSPVDLRNAKLKIATVGKGSAQALHNLGFADVMTPSTRFDTEGLLMLLPQVAGWRVMILRGEGGRELLGDTLRSRGARVEYVACYRRSKSKQKMNALLAAQLISVSSSEALRHLWQLVERHADPVLSGVPNLPLFVPHARIAELARLQGWTDVNLTEAGDAGLLSGVLDWAGHQALNSEVILNIR